MRDRYAFVTSGATGLGQATVRCLLETGWNVFFTYRESHDAALSLVEFGKALGRRVACAQADLLSREETLAAVDHGLEMMPRMDAFVHNFGPFVFDRTATADYSDELWTKMLDGNLNNFFWIYQKLVPGMRRLGFGRIVTVGYDGAGDAAGWRFRGPYAAAKSALASLTRSIAREERQNGITANMVCPGDIRGSHKTLMIRDVATQENIIGRPAVGEDVARLIVYLCAEQSQQVNATVTQITGGYDILAYDDGKEVVSEPVIYQIGDTVFVYPWARTGAVMDILQVPNRQVVYRVRSGEEEGSFTSYQLQAESGQ